MRDINDYEEQYLHEDPANVYEHKYQVRFRQEIVNQAIAKYTPRTVLEIGCANDSQYFHLDTKPEKYVICEPGHRFIKNAKEMIHDANVDYIEGLLQDKIAELRQYDFDFIILGSLLHEIEDAAGFLKAVRSIAKEHTIVHLNVPNANSLHRILAVESGLIPTTTTMTERNNVMQQNHIFSLISLTELIQSIGGLILEKGSYAFKPFTHKQMLQLVNAGIVTEEVLDGFNRCSKYFPNYGSEIYVNFTFSK